MVLQGEKQFFSQRRTFGQKRPGESLVFCASACLNARAGRHERDRSESRPRGAFRMNLPGTGFAVALRRQIV